MVDLDTVESEIIDLEKRDTTFATCERLAWLYIVRDHLRAGARPAAASAEPETTGALGESEFLAAASGVSVPDLMSVMDEHMEAMRVVLPKAYEITMSKIRSLDKAHKA